MIFFARKIQADIHLRSQEFASLDLAMRVIVAMAVLLVAIPGAEARGPSGIGPKTCLAIFKPTPNITIVMEPSHVGPRGGFVPFTPRQLKNLEALYGARIVADNANAQIPNEPKKFKGILIHFIDNIVGLKKYQGEINVFQNRSRLYQSVLDNKWAEYEIARQAGPEFMPESRLSSDIIENYTQREAYRETRVALAQALDRYVSGKGTYSLPNETRDQVQTLLSHFLAATELAFPKGSFIKYIKERQTGDRGQTIRTPEASAQKLAEEFMNELERAKKESSRAVKKFSNPSFLELLNEKDLSSVNLVRSLVLKPTDIFAQEKLSLAKTRDGTLAEVRIDFTSIGPINATLRWGYDVSIDYQNRAMEFFKSFIAKAPESVKSLSGGADIVFLNDGSLRIIEFNFGSDSGFAYSGELMIPGNLFVSKILESPTPLIERLEKLVYASLKDQIKYLSETKPEFKKDNVENQSPRDMYLPDAFQYLRDRLIEDWLENPTRTQGDKLIERFSVLARSQAKRITDPTTKNAIEQMARYGADFINERLQAQLPH